MCTSCPRTQDSSSFTSPDFLWPWTSPLSLSQSASKLQSSPGLMFSMCWGLLLNTPQDLLGYLNLSRGARAMMFGDFLRGLWQTGGLSQGENRLGRRQGGSVAAAIKSGIPMNTDSSETPLATIPAPRLGRSFPTLRISLALSDQCFHSL